MRGSRRRSNRTTTWSGSIPGSCPIHIGFEVLYVYRGVVRKYSPATSPDPSQAQAKCWSWATKRQDPDRNRTNRRFLDDWSRAVNQHGLFSRIVFGRIRAEAGYIKDMSKHYRYKRPTCVLSGQVGELGRLISRSNSSHTPVPSVESLHAIIRHPRTPIGEPLGRTHDRIGGERAGTADNVPGVPFSLHDNRSYPRRTKTLAAGVHIS